MGNDCPCRKKGTKVAAAKNKVTPKVVVHELPTVQGLSLADESCQTNLAEHDEAMLVQKVAKYLALGSNFFESKHEHPKESMQRLIEKISTDTEGDVLFYSTPGGRGRGGIVVLDGDVVKQSSFLVVQSSNANFKVHDVAPESHIALLRKALAEEAAVSDIGAAACVITGGVIEGVLFVEKPLMLGHSASEIERVLSVRLWANMLGERLEKLRWRQAAQDAEQALNTVLATMERVVNHEFSPDTVAMARDMIPHRLLQGHVAADKLALWFYDEQARELVLNNSGSNDGLRLSIDKTLTGSTLLRNSGEIVCLHDARQESRVSVVSSVEGMDSAPHSLISVPITRPKNAGQPDAGHFRTAVIEFRRCNSGDFVEKDALSHFDLVGAECLQRSVLPTLLWLRDCFLHMLASEQQRLDVQAVVTRLSAAADVKGVVSLVEHEVAYAMNCEACTLYFIDESRSEVWAPPTEKLSKGIRIKLGEGVVGTMAKSALDTEEPGEQDVFVVNDPSSCDLWIGDVCEDFITRNIMTAPVRSPAGGRRRLLGIVQVLNKRDLKPRNTHSKIEVDDTINFTHRDVMLLGVLCQAVGSHLQRLILEIMWTKTRLDNARDIKEDGMEDTPLLVQEYYDKGTGARKDGQLSSAASPSAEGKRQVKTITRTESTTRFNTRKRNDKKSKSDLPGVGEHEFLGGELANAIDDDLMEEIMLMQSDGPQVDVTHWHIYYWTLSEAEQFNLLLQTLRLHDLFQHFPVPRETLWNYFVEVKSSYRDVPYHNFHHAMATVHYSHKLLQVANIAGSLEKSDLFALFIGALCHDIDHRGRNTAFEVMTRSDLALRYNDSSPLENHHCARAFEIALGGADNDPDCNIFSGFSSEKYTSIRRRMVAGILSTDMKHHGHHVAAMQTFSPEPGAHDAQNQFYVELLLHTADISNPLMPVDIAAQWTRAISEEFTAQTEEEKLLGIPVTSFMTGLTDAVSISKVQLGFINFVINPLLDPMFRIFNGLLSEPKLFLDQNKDVHAKVIEQSV